MRRASHLFAQKTDKNTRIYIYVYNSINHFLPLFAQTQRVFTVLCFNIGKKDVFFIPKRSPKICFRNNSVNSSVTALFEGISFEVCPQKSD
jgi:hypothetical protein